MKSKIKQFLFSSLLLFPTVAVASERHDSGMGLVYGFLALCGLIILLQCIPLILLVWGMIKGVFQGKNVMNVDEK
jgi:uncharacterized membrane protein YhaH (DUF805 family)